MEQRLLRRTGLSVSRLCFGTMTFGAQVSEVDSHKILDWSLDAGINFFDTANVYNNGESERIIGKWLPGRRNQIVLASKVRGKMGDGPDDVGLSAAAIRKGIEESLRRLNTDYLDIYYLHQPDYAVPMEESLETMQQLIWEGKVRYAACSNYSAWQMTRMHWIADDRGYQPVSIAQPMYNLIARGLEPEFAPMSAALDISMVVYNPLAGGLLTGKQRKDAPVSGSRFDGNKMYLDRYWHDAQFEAIETLREAAQAAGRSLVSLALNWLLHHSPAECLILGASRLEQLQENVAAATEGPLAPETLEICEAVWRRLRGVTPQYNR